MSTHLISSQDLEGGDDLVRCVCVGRFPGHEVNEGLECDSAAAVGIYYSHDASELSIALATEKHQVNRKDGQHFGLSQTDMNMTV